MRNSSIFLHVAISLFVAPTPGLLILLYAHGGGSIPPSQGLIVLVASAMAYWVWLLNRNDNRETERQTAAARLMSVERPDLFGDTLPVAGRYPVSRHSSVRGHEDLADPLGDRTRKPPRKILSDRVADMRSIKTLVEEHHVPLLNGFHRTVDRDEFGGVDYKEWAYEADRFLMSSAFASRTLSRHEAIACLTAEVEHRSNNNKKAGEAGWRATVPPTAVAQPVAQPQSGQQPAAEPLFAAAQAPLSPRASSPRPPVTPTAPAAPTQPAAQRVAAPTPQPTQRVAARPAPVANPAASPASNPLDLTAYAMPVRGDEPGEEPISRRLARRMAEHRSRTFTENCTNILSDHGWETHMTDSPGTDAVDIFAERGDIAVGLRCLANDKSASEDVIHQVAEARNRFGLDSIGIVSRQGFSRAARSAATLKSVTLLDMDDLPDLHLFVSHRRKTVVPLFREARGN